jgi:flap endonuclease GEN
MLPYIEAGLGLKRKHLIAISLLVGNDHDLNGVQGIGLEKALRFVQSFSEDEILNQFASIPVSNSVVVVVVMYLKIMLSDNVVLS